jgi:hypothetical protein
VNYFHLLPIDIAERSMGELRTAVMILVEACWQDQSGKLQTVPARMEDKSDGGACIRLKAPIGVGSKLKVQWRWGQFSGITKYCRSEGWDYVVGIQRDATNSPVFDQPASADVPRQKTMRSGGPRSGGPVVSTEKTQDSPARPESHANEIPEAERKVEAAPIVRAASSAITATTTPPAQVGYEMDDRGWPRIARPPEFDALRRTRLRSNQPPKEAGNERKPMRRNWLGLATWRNQEDDLSAGGDPGGDGNGNGNGERENLMLQVSPHAKKASAHSAREVPTFQVELSPMEDIYRAAGIMLPRKGYSINKVVEMLRSVHIRPLSKEMQRAAVLMALDAAGITVDQVEQDAKARQDALDSYEAEQRTQVEVEWARKAGEIAQIQAELESITAHYNARISRTLEGVARERATFDNWVTLKQQERQGMADAVELCLKSTAPANISTSDVGMAKATSAAAVGSKPV